MICYRKRNLYIRACFVDHKTILFCSYVAFVLLYFQLLSDDRRTYYVLNDAAIKAGARFALLCL